MSKKIAIILQVDSQHYIERHMPDSYFTRLTSNLFANSSFKKRCDMYFYLWILEIINSDYKIDLQQGFEEEDYNRGFFFMLGVDFIIHSILWSDESRYDKTD